MKVHKDFVRLKKNLPPTNEAALQPQGCKFSIPKLGTILLIVLLYLPAVQARNPGPLKCSKSTCSSLGWTEDSEITNSGNFGSDTICGASYSSPLLSCSGMMDFQSARHFCEDAGSR